MKAFIGRWWNGGMSKFNNIFLFYWRKDKITSRLGLLVIWEDVSSIRSKCTKQCFLPVCYCEYSDDFTFVKWGRKPTLFLTTFKEIHWHCRAVKEVCDCLSPTFSPSLSSLLFFSPSPASPSPSVCLSLCLSLSILLLSGPQNKDSRESLTYDGEEKEVRVLCHMLLMYDAQSISLSSLLDGCVCEGISSERHLRCLRERERKKDSPFILGMFYYCVDLGDPSYAQCFACVV